MGKSSGSLAPQVARDASPIAADHCARCGAPFHCGVNDATGCWCAQLPALPRHDYVAEAGCLCAACLREALAAAANPPTALP